MKDISIQEALDDGVYTRHTNMENGELRYRLVGEDNSSYIRTVAKKECWENSHYHKFCYESYIVQRGIVFICLLVDGELKIRKMQQGDQMVLEPHIIHNIYMCEGAVTHTVKFGECYNDDWIMSKEFDEITKNLTLSQLEVISKENFVF